MLWLRVMDPWYLKGVLGILGGKGAAKKGGLEDRRLQAQACFKILIPPHVQGRQT